MSAYVTPSLLRSYIPSSTLLPFLYNTSTIQQSWRTLGQPITRRAIGTQPIFSEYVPFEGETLPPNIDIAEPPRKSTITSTERAAFQKLYRRFDTRNWTRNEHEHVADLDQIKDQRYEEAEFEEPPRTLDNLFDEVFKGMIKIRGSSSDTPAFGEQKRRLAKQKQSLTKTDKDAMNEHAGENETTELKELRLAERSRVDTLFKSATTDYELWETLEREVLEPIRKLDLDSTTKKALFSSSKSSDKSASHSQIAFLNYPYHLVTALLTLRSTFPASTLPFNILPTIRTLGRSAYTLGATSMLYKHLLRCAWLQQSSYSHVDELLIDMENSAIEFDNGILEVLDAILKEHLMIRRSLLGKEIQLVYETDLFLEGIYKIQQWRKIVVKRLGIPNRAEVHAAEQRRNQERRQIADRRRSENSNGSFTARKTPLEFKSLFKERAKPVNMPNVPSVDPKQQEQQTIAETQNPLQASIKPPGPNVPIPKAPIPKAPIPKAPIPKAPVLATQPKTDFEMPMGHPNSIVVTSLNGGGLETSKQEAATGGKGSAIEPIKPSVPKTMSPVSLKSGLELLLDTVASNKPSTRKTSSKTASPKSGLDLLLETAESNSSRTRKSTSKTMSKLSTTDKQSRKASAASKRDAAVAQTTPVPVVKDVEHAAISTKTAPASSIQPVPAVKSGLDLLIETFEANKPIPKKRGRAVKAKGSRAGKRR